MMSLFAFFGAPWEMFLVLVVVLLLFGNRLPTVMRSLGKGVTEFKKGIEGIEDDIDASAKKTQLKSETAPNPPAPPAAGEQTAKT
jgi:sec-independent protein translocase protein TatA